MKRTLLTLPVLLLLTLAVPASSQESSITGSWTLNFSSTQGAASIPVELTQDGTTLRGTSGGVMGFRTDFEDGSVDGNSFAFDIFVEVEGDWYPLVFSGRVEGEELTGNVDIPDGTRATFRGVRTPTG